MINARINSHKHLLSHSFKLGNGSVRNSTDAILLEIDCQGVIGFGEASLPPYLLETQSSVEAFVKQWMFHVKTMPNSVAELHRSMGAISAKDFSAKAAIDIAWHDWKSKSQGVPLYKMLQLSSPVQPATFTLGISTIAELEKRWSETDLFSSIKLKVGRETSLEQLQWMRSKTDKPLMADANGAFSNAVEALPLLKSLADAGFLFCEQPLQKGSWDELLKLRAIAALPLFADEDCQSVLDMETCAKYYDGVNIKLMKCGGIYPALQAINEAKSLGLQVVLGSMTECSIAISAAIHISSLVDYIDLDGPWLISNNPFQNPKLENGVLQANHLPGLGLIKV